MIYLDNAATTLHKPERVADAVAEAMKTMGNSSRGTHAGSLGAARTITGARVKLAELFGCDDASRVIFTGNATEALNVAINGIVCPGDHVITTDWEHNSVLRPLYRLEKEQGIRLDFIPADRRGSIDYSAFERLLKPGTKAVICTHASNLTGNLMDLAAVGRMARENGSLFIVDASQTAGVFPIDMQELNIDVLCFSGHKGLMGPQGTGGLCISQGTEIRPWKVGGTGIKTYSHFQPEDYPERLEAGTLNGHGIAGLSAALDFIAETGIAAILEKEKQLADLFYKGVRTIPKVTVYGDYLVPKAPVVALNIGDYDSASVADELSERYGIAVRPGGHCAPRMHLALGTAEQGAVRFSFSWFNTETEVETAVDAVRRIAE